VVYQPSGTWDGETCSQGEDRMTMPVVRIIGPSSAMRIALTALGLCLCISQAATAMMCADGVYRAGCAGPNGAVVVNKAPPAYYGRPPPLVYHNPPVVHCASGVYRAGCAGPNGAAVVRRPY
jgi:hypothetical protein